MSERGAHGGSDTVRVAMAFAEAFGYASAMVDAGAVPPGPAGAVDRATFATAFGRYYECLASEGDLISVREAWETWTWTP